jgi:hypothetical protein
MVKANSYRFVIVAALALVSSLSTVAVAQQDKATAQLKTVLNSKGYILNSPAESWPYAGGFLVANKSTTNFIDLPSGSPKLVTQDVSADFMAEQHKSKFSISAVLTGMLALMGGNPGGAFSHAGNQNFQELSARGKMIKFQAAQDILADKDVQSTVNTWLNDGSQVFIIGVILTTKKLSVTSDSATTLDISYNGKPVSPCTQDSSTPKKSSDSSNPTSSDKGTSVDSSKPATSNKPTTSSSTGTTSPAKISPSATDKTTPSPLGGEAHFCRSNSNAVTMNTDEPLAFAAGAYLISKNKKDGKLSLGPFFVVPRNGQFERVPIVTAGQLQHFQEGAALIDPRWHRKPWPGQ